MTWYWCLGGMSSLACPSTRKVVTALAWGANLLTRVSGYSGVAIYTRNATCAPIRAEEGVLGVLCPPKSSTMYRNLPENQQIGGYPRPGQLSGIVDDALLDSEGRCLILEFPAFVLFGVYSPAARDETRDDFRTSFFEALDIRIRNLVAEGKQVILTGDLNVSRSEMDSTNVMEALRKEGMTLDEWMSTRNRRVFNQLLFEGTVLGERDEGREKPVLWDLCRCFHPTRQAMNTCWDTKRNTRPANNGSRIDYVLCSDGIKDWFTHANIQEGLMGSDHCPVFGTMADQVTHKGKQVALLDVMNPAGVFDGSRRLRELGQKDMLALSAKLIPEFDRRQSIRDMFFRKATPSMASGSSLKTESSSKSEADDSQSTVYSTISNPKHSSDTPDATIIATASGIIANENVSEPATQKRPPEQTSAVGRQTKRPKSTTDTSPSKPKQGTGQQTLRGFFKPIGAAGTTSAKDPRTTSTRDEGVPLKTSSTSIPAQSTASVVPAPLTARTSTSSTTATALEASESVFDPIENKESWSKLLGKRVVPRCEHNEPCISLLTKKAGVNKGSSVPSQLFFWPTEAPAVCRIAYHLLLCSS